MEDVTRMLADKLAITELLYRYARAADAGDLAAIEEIFTPDVEVEFNGQAPERGREKVIAGLRAAQSACSRTHHMFTNVEIELAGDTAFVRLRGQAFHARDEGEETKICEILADWDADVVRTPGGWRTARWRMTCLHFSSDPDEFWASAAVAAE